MSSFSAACEQYVMQQMLKKLGKAFADYPAENTAEENNYALHFRARCPKLFLGTFGSFTITVEPGLITISYCNTHKFAINLLTKYRNYFASFGKNISTEKTAETFSIKATFDYQPAKKSLKQTICKASFFVAQCEEIFNIMADRQSRESNFSRLRFDIGCANNLLLADKEGKNLLNRQFDTIYEVNYWDDGWGSGSGSGSAKELTAGYREFLQNFFKEHNIKSIVDVGCGDWQFTQYLDLSGIDYTGYDVVEKIIQNNKASFAKSNVKFVLYDGDFSKISGSADLLICKDVLQHLPNSYVFDFLKLLPKFKFALIANSHHSDPAENNKDLAIPGRGRPLALLEPPFSIRAQEVFSISRTHQGMPQYRTQVLLVDNS